MKVACWNVAAVNNNPFEYWISSTNPDYEALMESVEKVIADPQNDWPVQDIFLQEMFEDLLNEMERVKIPNLQELGKTWEHDFKLRNIISGFLKDKSLGAKRLMSMPDRITNTINLASGRTCTRPTVINGYDGGELQSIQSWWKQWKTFMFYTTVEISSGEGAMAAQLVCDLIGPILRSKYPAISIKEQAISVQLQILALAILDAIFIFIVNRAFPSKWESVRTELCKGLIHNKSSRICSILDQSYNQMDVVFIQEAAAVFVQQVQNVPALKKKYLLVHPWNLDGKRDQNSVILVDRNRFREKSCEEVTQSLLDTLDGSWLAPGDLLAVSIEDSDGRLWLLASFHGDSNGLSTHPMILAAHRLSQTSRFKSHILLIGADANTYSASPDAFHNSVSSFSQLLGNLGMVSLWGERPDPSARTTRSARTHLQTQQNKAVCIRDRWAASQQNLRDWIIAYRHHVVDFTDVVSDNTGDGRLDPGIILPTLEFPSDHTIISAVLRVRTTASESDVGATATLSECGVFHGASICVHDSTSSDQVEKKASKAFRKREMTLYDYWGIGQKPLATASWVAQPGPATDAFGVDVDPGGPMEGGRSVKEEVEAVLERQYVQAATGTPGEGLDAQVITLSIEVPRAGGRPTSRDWGSGQWQGCNSDGGMHKDA